MSAADRSVITWGSTTLGDTTTITNFVVAAGETFNFVLPSGGAILNRVTAGTNTTNAAFDGNLASAAVINGTLISNGRVVVLANGNIVVGQGAQISTAGGLVLSTLNEDNFNFTATGNIAGTGASQGNIYLGSGAGAAAASVIGNLNAHAGLVVPNNLTVSGDLIVANTGGALALTTAHSTTVGGNLTVTTNNLAIGQGAGALLVANGHTQLNSGTGATSLTVATNNFNTVGANTTGLTGNVSITDANILTLAASNIGGDLTVIAGGTSGSTAIANNGTLTIGGNASFSQTATGNSAINIGNSSTVAGALLLAASNSSVTYNGVGNLTLGNGTVVGAALTAGVRSNLTVTTNGVLTIGNTVSVTAATSNNGVITLNGGSIVQNADITSASGNGTITLNATSGNITLGNVTNSGTGGIGLRTAGGSINQNVGTKIVTTNTSSQTSTVNVTTSGTANLTNANQYANNSILQITAGTATINNTAAANTLQIGTSNVTGNLSILNDALNNSVVLGVGTGTAAQNLTVGGTLNAIVAGTGTITDGDYTVFNIFGGLNLTTGGGAVTLDAATANGVLAPSVLLGQVKINAGAGAVTVSERTTLNLSNITASSLTATSTQGGIINTGDLTISGAATFTSAAGQSSVITNGTNAIGTVNFLVSGGAVTVGNGGGGSVTLGATTNVTSGDVAINTTNGGDVIFGGGSIAGNLTVNSSDLISNAASTLTTVGGNLSLTAANTGASSIIQNASGRFLVNGTTTIASMGNVSLNQGNDFVGAVIINQAGTTGDIVVNDHNNITISGSTGGNLNVQAGATAFAVDAPWNVVLGNLSVASLNATATNGGGGNSGTITQAAGTSVSSFGTFRAITNNGNIVIANNGNNAGRVEFFTSGGTSNGTATISYTEDGTIRLGNVASNSNITLTSRFGSIIEDTNANSNYNSRATLNVSAPNGSILLGNTTQTTFSTTANVATLIASAPTGAVAVMSNNNITLNSVNANSLIVNVTNNITQTNGLRIFGTASFTAGRNITLTNSTNNFGPVSLNVTSTNNNIAVSENGTLNLRKITMAGAGNGTVTLTSLTGDIIDTGLGGVIPGGSIASPGSGVITLTAASGNIVLDDPTTDFASNSGIVFNAQNVTLAPLGNAQLVLGAAGVTSVAGNLTATSAIGSIANAGDLNIAGAAVFTTGNGNIQLGQSGNRFGSVRFTGNQIAINQVNDMSIIRGSTAIGAAQLASSTGSVTINPTGSGVVSFGNTAIISAGGNITLPKLIQSVGVLTVNAPGTKDLSALSIPGDLGGQAPVNLGTGSYLPPQP
ncbi:MAG: hypothetical protein Q8N18_14925 [Opitutaceae bacterium]|nr:hypothetical protein [Opitutaceae bacterium]